MFQRYVREYYARALGLDSEDDLPDHPERKLKCATIGDGLRIPAELAERLFPYQVKGVHWMWGLHRAGTGGILADEMGVCVG